MLPSQAEATAEAARAVHEGWLMNMEDIAGHQGNLVKEFTSACEESKEALAFSWRTVQQMETRDAQDWTQVNVNPRYVVKALHLIDARGDCSCQQDL